MEPQAQGRAQKSFSYLLRAPGGDNLDPVSLDVTVDTSWVFRELQEESEAGLGCPSGEGESAGHPGTAEGTPGDQQLRDEPGLRCGSQQLELSKAELLREVKQLRAQVLRERGSRLQTQEQLASQAHAQWRLRRAVRRLCAAAGRLLAALEREQQEPEQRRLQGQEVESRGQPPPHWDHLWPCSSPGRQCLNLDTSGQLSWISQQDPAGSLPEPLLLVQVASPPPWGSLQASALPLLLLQGSPAEEGLPDPRSHREEQGGALGSTEEHGASGRWRAGSICDQLQEDTPASKGAKGGLRGGLLTSEEEWEGEAEDNRVATPYRPRESRESPAPGPLAAPEEDPANRRQGECRAPLLLQQGGLGDGVQAEEEAEAEGLWFPAEPWRPSQVGVPLERDMEAVFQLLSEWMPPTNAAPVSEWGGQGQPAPRTEALKRARGRLQGLLSSLERERRRLGHQRTQLQREQARCRGILRRLQKEREQVRERGQLAEELAEYRQVVSELEDCNRQSYLRIVALEEENERLRCAVAQLREARSERAPAGQGLEGPTSERVGGCSVQAKALSLGMEATLVETSRWEDRSLRARVQARERSEETEAAAMAWIEGERGSPAEPGQAPCTSDDTPQLREPDAEAGPTQEVLQLHLRRLQLQVGTLQCQIRDQGSALGHALCLRDHLRGELAELQRTQHEAKLAAAPLKAKLASLVHKCQERNHLISQLLDLLHRHRPADPLLEERAQGLLEDPALAAYTATFLPMGCPQVPMTSNPEHLMPWCLLGEEAADSSLAVLPSPALQPPCQLLSPERILALHKELRKSLGVSLVPQSPLDPPLDRAHSISL